MELEFSLAKENMLLEILEHSFSYFNLEDLAKIVSLNKRLMNALSQSPRLLIAMIKKFYLSQNHVHPTLRRYFQILLTKRPKISISNLGDIAKEIYFLAEYRIEMSRNLIRDGYCTKYSDQILETRGGYGRRNIPTKKPENPLIERKHGGDGWSLKSFIIPEFLKRTLANSFEMSEISYKAFFKQFPSDFLQDFKNGRTLLKAGCFISRRWDCEAHGGCILQIFGSDNQLLFDKRQHKRSDELPISVHVLDSNNQLVIDFKQNSKSAQLPNYGDYKKTYFGYEEILFVVSHQDLPQNIDLAECYMKLIIYGKDERWWKGNYGSCFTGMYIRGDFVENPLKKLLN